MIELVNWDTDNFGIKVGNLTLPALPSVFAFKQELQRAKLEGYDLLYLKGVDLPDTYMLENIFLVDNKVDYIKTIDMNQNKIAKDNNIISLLNHEASEDIVNLSCQSGIYSRYKTDDNMPNNIFETLYGLWIKRSLNGDIATDVIGYIDNQKTLGILTYQKDGSDATIGILAVDSCARGKGIGTRLMNAFLASLEPGTKVHVATQQRNECACHFYEKYGFRIEKISKIYHIWLQHISAQE